VDDLLLGICGEEMEMTGVSLLSHEPLNDKRPVVEKINATTNSGVVFLSAA
jgi:hypothetical protein